jgi:glycosyltransferase involved in cell wall biosynthesis
LPNGVGNEFFSIEREYSAPGTRFRFITTGSLIPRKSLETALNALAKAGLDQAELVVIGGGPERSHLEELARALNLGSRIRFLGEIPPEQVSGELAAADAFVFTSTSEGRPNAVLEAMAAGLPIAASRIDGVAELITDRLNGLLFETGNTDALAACLTRLASDPDLRRRLGSAARQSLIDQDLTWDRAATQYLQVYEACILQAN